MGSVSMGVVRCEKHTKISSWKQGLLVIYNKIELCCFVDLHLLSFHLSGTSIVGKEI